MSMNEVITNQIREIVGEEGLTKAHIVASRAALLKEFDPDIDMTGLIIGLYVGNDGEMPDSLPLGALGLIHTLALSQIESISDKSDTPDP